MRLTDLILYGLANWRLATMLVNEEGPGRIFVKLREKTGVLHDVNGVPDAWTNDYTPLHCLLCTSLWTAVLLLLLPRFVVTMIGLSGLAILIDGRLAPQK